MNKAIVISHSSRDDEFVSRLCQAMESQGLYNWVDSSDLRGGNDLTPQIHETIKKSRAFIVVISPDAFNSAWVAEETQYASHIKKSGRESYPIIALLREGVELGALKWIFSKEPVAIRVKSDMTGIRAAMPHILSALGERFTDDPRQTKTDQTEPLEELVLELRSPHIGRKDGKRRPAAEAELSYIPTTLGEQRIKCLKSFLFTSPLGPFEIEELRWYLERYYLWPTGKFRTRAENVEKKLPEWGQGLYREVMPESSCRNIIDVWHSIDTLAECHFTIFVDIPPTNNGLKQEQDETEEAAALLMGLPWELIHDGENYLFQGANSVRARRRLR
ncbi:MAG: hypothetical protein DRI57_17415 [Deltaproteobacteria bacterium]|nr:MAG: hypothetical protein DRI57_17415 [Deltaproteobacteria bacterium]